MIPVTTIFEDVTLDNAVVSENGELSIQSFTRISERAELKTLDFLTGSIVDPTPPAIYTSEKVRGWASPFSVKKLYNISDGVLLIPSDFYLYDTMAVSNSMLKADCETGIQSQTDDPDVPIEVLDPQVFDDRVNTYVGRLKPTISHPIAKRVGNTFEFLPKDLGTIKLTYYRYPVYAKIVVKDDPIFRNEVIDIQLSTNYEWGMYARELIGWFITDIYANKTREVALKQLNTATGKTVQAR